MTTIRNSLLELAKETMTEIQQESDFQLEDYKIFGRITHNLIELSDMSLKPYLTTWHMNKWEPYLGYIEQALDLLGYEYVGRMEVMLEDNLNYKFNVQDITYDALYRFKDKCCDYTQSKYFG